MQIARSASLAFHGVIALILGVGAAVIGAEATPVGPWLGLLPVAVVLWVGGRKPLRRWLTARQPFPSGHRAFLEEIPFYRGLDAAGRAHFERDVQFVLDEWTFEGVEGVEVTDRMRVAVAAGVATLLHGRPDWELAPHHTVLFYPGRFDDAYYESEEADFDGMAHAQGPIILSVEAVEESLARPGDGNNVILHELAHLFDFANAYADGVPSLLDPASVEAWQALVRREMQRARLGKSLLRRYAATNPAEFFAVAVENFFERPEVLYRRHPELYEALSAFFNLELIDVSEAVTPPEGP